MLTLFSIPKPFQGHIEVIQRNAIQSWIRLHPDCEIILCGDDHGTKEAAAEFRVKYMPGIARNPYGTPLVSSAFEQVEKTASHRLLCYVNADIILIGSFISAIQSIPFSKFLMVGQRWDIDVSDPINFGTDGWEDHLKKHVAENGSLHPPTGIDYFAFPRGVMGVLPPFAVGRPGWDNWFIYRARALGVPVIDATRAVSAIHQEHDYTHVKLATDGAWEGPEAIGNRRLMADWQLSFTIRDATYFLTPNRSMSTVSPFSLRRNWWALPALALNLCKNLSYVIGAGVRAVERRLFV